jgi:hypothetical protein
MPNQLERIMAYANAGKKLYAPTAGVQKVVNADGSTTEIPYMEDRFGRRTVMTREGPKVIPGFEGKDVYGDLGGKIGNLLGGLINKGRLGRQERIAKKSLAEQEMANLTLQTEAAEREAKAGGPKRPGEDWFDYHARVGTTQEQGDAGRAAATAQRVPANQAELEKARERLNYKTPTEKIDYFDMSKLGSKSKTALSRVEMGDGSILIQESSTDAQGNPTVRFIDPNSGTQIGQTITTGLGMPKASVQNVEQSSSGNASPTVNPRRNRFGAAPKVLTQEEQMINDFLPNNVSVDGRAGTTLATPEQRRQARERANRPARQLDLELLEYLTPDERDEYRNRNTTNERFKSLDTKARVKKTKGEVVEPTFMEKEEIKKDAKRRLDLQEGSASRKSSLEQAERFLGAFKGNEKDLEYFNLDEVDSGAGRAAASYIPGTYTSQGKFDEELDAFAEVAARQMLKAMGEVRPTNEDVEGAKKAVFGIGKDERTNVRLLKKYIEEQKALEAEAKRLNTNRSASATSFLEAASQD